jgi:predicted PurR-regulated permease PerM
VLRAGLGKVVPAAIGVVSGLSTAVLILVLAAFLVHEPAIYRRGVRLLVPRESEPAFDEGYRRLARGLRGWIGGVFVAMLLMGTLTALGLRIAGIENWFLLGILTFICTFVPYLGAIVSAIPGLLMGLAQSPQHFLYACVVYVGVHIVEGYIVEPFVMRRAVDIRPATLLLGQALFGAVFGILGIVVASPAIACIQIVAEYFYVERRLGKRAGQELKQAA